MWAELVGQETVDSRVWPRTAAIAERFWSPADVNDVDSMYTRLEAISRNLEFTGVLHRANYSFERWTASPAASRWNRCACWRMRWSRSDWARDAPDGPLA